MFENKCCLIKDASNNDIFKVKMKGKSFALNLLEEEQITFPSKENSTELLHKRLGHYHSEGLSRMKSKGMAKDLPKFDENVSICMACQF